MPSFKNGFNDEAPVRRAQGLRRMTNDEARMVRAGLALDEDENGGSASARPGHAEACPGRNDLPRDVALREEAKAFALQNRCGAL